MPGRTSVDAAPTTRSTRPAITVAKRPRFVRSRQIEKAPPLHGEKPYAELVVKSFDGPVLRLSERMKLLEEADNRKIRRGDALDLIVATQQELEAKHAVKKPHTLEIFFKQYAVFVVCYVAFALIWCMVMSLSPSKASTSSAAAASESQVHAARVDPPFNQ
ncbi:MAG: hypothetical protein QOE14_1813 [Humisphaera sp.]|nr:hypothetical protein [Humisphaera sp.]